MRERPSPARTLGAALLGAALVVPLGVIGAGPAGAVEADPLPGPMVVLDDFEDGQLPRTTDPDGNGIGVFEFSGDGYAYSYVGPGNPPWTPSPGGGQSLVLGSNTTSFAGLVRIFAEGDPLD